MNAKTRRQNSKYSKKQEMLPFFRQANFVKGCRNLHAINVESAAAAVDMAGKIFVATVAPSNSTLKYKECLLAFHTIVTLEAAYSTAATPKAEGVEQAAYT